jgi:adenine-specific DNA-methyltransferase
MPPRRREWNFLGNKSQMTGWLCDLFPAGDRVADICAGTCSVSRALAARGKEVWANDAMEWCSVLARAYLLAPPVAWVLTPVTDTADTTSPGFVERTYTPAGGRMYFTQANGRVIDAVRAHIATLRDSPARDVALTALLHAAMLVANTAGQFRAYLKAFKPSALAPLALDASKLGGPAGGTGHRVTHEDIFAPGFLEAVAQWADVVYLDPPYTCRHYAKYYHVLETIAKGDAPCVEGRTGCRADAVASPLGCAKTAAACFEDIVRRLRDAPGRRAQYLVISYSTDGLVNEGALAAILGDSRIFRRPHPRYQSRRGPLRHVDELAFVTHL